MISEKLNCLSFGICLSLFIHSIINRKQGTDEFPFVHCYCNVAVTIKYLTNVLNTNLRINLMWNTHIHQVPKLSDSACDSTTGLISCFHWCSNNLSLSLQSFIATLHGHPSILAFHLLSIIWACICDWRGQHYLSRKQHTHVSSLF